METRVSRSWVALALLLTLVLLTPLAYASPPDPVWVSGYFDDGDYDDVVLLVTSWGAAVDPFPLAHESVIQTVVDAAVPDEPQLIPATVLSSSTPRSPPAS